MLTVTITPDTLDALVEQVAKAVAAKLLAERPTYPGQQIPADRLALPADEAAASLGISSRLLWDLTAPRGSIRSVRAGSRVLYPVDELKRWLATEA